MARAWHYTKLTLSSALLLLFFWHDVCVLYFLPNYYVLCVFVSFFYSFLFRFCFVFLLSSELCRCSSDLFLSSRPRPELATTYITGYS